MAPVSKSQQKATHKYIKKTYDRVELLMPKGKRERVRQFAAENGESVNSFVNRLIDEAMAQKEKQSQE